MIEDVLGDIVAKNTKVLRPNNKINASVVVEDKTLRIAECIARHSEKSVSRVLSSMLDAASVEFLGMYRELLSKDERGAFDRAVLEGFDDDKVFDFVSLSPEEVLRYANQVSWFPTDDGGSGCRPVYLRAENRDGVFGVILPDTGAFVPMPVAEFTFDDDCEFRGEDIAFSRVRPCQEKDIRAVFTQARWMEAEGWMHFIESDLGISNLLANISPSYPVDATLTVDGKTPLPALPGFTYNDAMCTFETTIRTSLWTCEDSEQGLWSYEGRQYRFLVDQSLYVMDQEEADEDQ